MNEADSPTVTQVVAKHYVTARKSLMRSKKHDTLEEALDETMQTEVGFHPAELFNLDRAVGLLEKAGWIYAGESYDGQ